MLRTDGVFLTIVKLFLFALRSSPRLPQARVGTPRESSVRSAMFIATFRAESQAPLGAACRPTTPSREPSMPLLTELENHLLGQPGYRHGAPNGAVPPTQVREMYRPDSAEKPPLFTRKTPSPKKVSNECGNVQPRANSARLRGITITDGENDECRLRRGFFSRIRPGPFRRADTARVHKNGSVIAGGPPQRIRLTQRLWFRLSDTRFPRLRDLTSGRTNFPPAV
jgi:hypothetical protein